MRRIMWVGSSVVIVLVLVYLAVGYVIYTSLADVRGSCDKHMANRPELFTDTDTVKWPISDFSPYYFTDYESVSFPSRDAAIRIVGWYVQNDPQAPAIILVDGLGGCKHAPAVLVPAGLLSRSGFNLLLIDLRDTGDSGSEDGFSAIGNEEYLDVLGAWDWLQAQKGFAPHQIGIYGNSLGAATVMIAFLQEPRVAAVAVNSPFANLPQIMREELRRNHYPTWLAPAAVIMARLVKGDRLTAHSPLEAMAAAGDRPVFVTHSRDDERIGVHHSLQLQEVAVANGIQATFWFVDGVTHTKVSAAYPEEFQRRLSGFFREALR